MPITTSVTRRGSQARLRFQGDSPVGLDEVCATLAALDGAYRAVDHYKNLVRSAKLWAAEPRFGLWVREGPPRKGTAFWTGLVTERFDDELGLDLVSVVIESPGFWEFIGALNPLEQLRGYLVERHERMKDREYRNDAERRRLDAEASISEAAIRSAQVEVTLKEFEVAADMLGLEEARRRCVNGLLNLGEVLDKSRMLSSVPELIGGDNSQS